MSLDIDMFSIIYVCAFIFGVIMLIDRAKEQRNRRENKSFGRKEY